MDPNSMIIKVVWHPTKSSFVAIVTSNEVLICSIEQNLQIYVNYILEYRNITDFQWSPNGK